MIWARMLAYITGTVDQELLLRNEYLTAENRILRAQIKGRLLLSDAEQLRWLRSPTGSDGKPWKNWRLSRNRIRCWPGTESSSPTSSTDRSFANPMLATPLQAIGGTRTFTSQDSQHCRLLLTARYFSAGPSDSISRWTLCPPNYSKRWLQVGLGCVRRSPSCPFRRLHTFRFLRPARLITPLLDMAPLI